jgi:hypothetical protein
MVEDIWDYQQNWREHVERMQRSRVPVLALHFKLICKRNRRDCLRKRWKEEFLDESWWNRFYNSKI